MSADRPRLGRRAQWQRIRLRRLLAALLVGAGVVAGLSALRPAPEPTEQVIVAARDVAAGARLINADLRVEKWPRTVLPEGLRSREQLVGRHVLGPVAAGEPITRTRLLAGRNLQTPPGTDLTMSVPVSDPGLARLLRPGDRVDVMDPQGVPVARSAHVVAVVADAEGDWKSASAPSVLVAVSRAAAARMSQARGGATTGPAGLTIALVRPAHDAG